MSVIERQRYNRAEAAVALGKSVATIDNMVRDGRLTAYKIGHTTVFLREDLEKLITQSPIAEQRL